MPVSITTINSTDLVTDSRAVINTNFSNLKTAVDGMSAAGGPGGLYVQSAPLASGFTWFNQSTASATDNPSSLILQFPANSSGTQVRGIVKTMPAAPFSLTARIFPSMTYANACYQGIMFRESSSGKMITWHFAWVTDLKLGIFKYNSATSFNFDINSTAASPAFLQGCYLRMYNDATNIHFQYSYNGVTWQELTTQSLTGFATYDQIGLFNDSANNAVNSMAVTLFTTSALTAS
jgi:hypothetical protein